ncbi:MULTISPECIES: endonuclease/exonuclease/phosphatase family protein [unclassified Blastococcus]
MTSDRARRLRARSLLAVEVLLAALVPGVAATTAAATAAMTAATGGDGAGGVAEVTVMTQNLYVGAPLAAVFGAASEAELVAAGTRAWADVLAADLPARAAALADELARIRPDVLALQEASLWREEIPGDVLARPEPDAGDVALDSLAVLRDALRARGVPYTPVATSANADVEFPRLDPAAGPVDVRLTDRDVLLVRADVADRAGDARDGHYAAQFAEPFATGPLVASTRGWTSVDYRAGPGTTLRIVGTHLEVGDPVTGTTQEAQAAELVALLADSPHPVIALGDFNAPPGAPAPATYGVLTARLRDAWTAVRPADPGPTCCRSPSLADPVPQEAARVDLVLADGALAVRWVARTADRPFRSAPPPLWSSDHAGVVARLAVPAPRGGPRAGRRRPVGTRRGGARGAAAPPVRAPTVGRPSRRWS